MICHHTGAMNKCKCSEKVIGGKYFICKECFYTYSATSPEDEAMVDALQDRRLMCPLCSSKRIYFETPSSAVELIPSTNVKIGRNDPCPCLSGKKYKKCCLKI
jgi:uncharacterized protein YecA (UPF0149 family)